jgi:hypothetical protein
VRLESLSLAITAGRRFFTLSGVALFALGLLLDKAYGSGGILACAFLAVSAAMSFSLWGDLLAWREKSWRDWLIWLMLTPMIGFLALACTALSASALTDPVEGPKVALALLVVVPPSGALTALLAYRTTRTWYVP